MKMSTGDIEKFLINHKGYLKCSPTKTLKAITKKWDSVGKPTIEDIKTSQKAIRASLKASKLKVDTKPQPEKRSDLKASKQVSRPGIGKEGLFTVKMESRYMYDASRCAELKPREVNSLKPYTKGNPDNVLIIGDLHAPFILEGYLEFCRKLQEKHNCGTVVLIGDIIDGNSWSYHEHDVDGDSVKTEVNKAILQLQDWYRAFPIATVLYGNHDLLVSRKAKTAGLSQLFIRNLGEILGAPQGWAFTHEYIKDNVKYIHGSTGNAISRAKDERISICQGHLHSQAFVEYSVSERDAIFGLQIGCGIDREAYAFEYAKPMAKKPVISAGVILEKGTLPILELMKL